MFGGRGSKYDSPCCDHSHVRHGERTPQNLSDTSRVQPGKLPDYNTPVSGRVAEVRESNGGMTSFGFGKSKNDFLNIFWLGDSLNWT